MSDINPLKDEQLSPYIGQDFLTWLWFHIERSGGEIVTSQNEVFGLSMEQRISVQGGEGESKDTAVCSGPRSELREARLGLMTGKKVNQARLKIEQDSEAWQMQLRAEDFAMSGLKTPKVETKLEEGDDPDAPFLEKMYLVERCLQVVDELFAKFLRLRLSEDWAEEQKALRQWVQSDLPPANLT